MEKNSTEQSENTQYPEAMKLDISNLIEQIRDLINDTHLKNQLSSQPEKWHIICSAMDAIEDSDLAINKYQKSEIDKSKGDWQHNYGTLYIYIYGVLQALYIQQDAVMLLLIQLNLKNIWDEFSNQLSEIRDVRNNAIGHPVFRKGIRTSNFISRSEMSLKSFTMLVSSTKESWKVEHIEVHKLIATQIQIIKLCLEKTVLALRNSINDFRTEYMVDKLSELFKMKDWHFSKIHESIDNIVLLDFCSSALKCLENSIDQFIIECKQRNCLDLSTWEHEFEDIRLLSGRIYLEIRNEESNRDSLALDSYIVNLKMKIGLIEDIAKEIDEKFASCV